jgi:hypothetical protein
MITPICFLCNRNQYKVVLIKLPFEARYQKAVIEILGNITENEYICLPCMGFEFDKAMDKIEDEKP